jgi:hypothetical protein
VQLGKELGEEEEEDYWVQLGKEMEEQEEGYWVQLGKELEEEGEDWEYKALC